MPSSGFFIFRLFKLSSNYSGGGGGSGTCTNCLAPDQDAVITAKFNFTQTILGNTTSANKLFVPRTIALSGAITGSVSFDGSQDVTINTLLSDNSIGTSKLQVKSVTTSKLDDYAVTTNKILDYSVTTEKLADSSVTFSKLGPDVVQYFNDLADLIANYQPPDNSITDAKIGPRTIDTNIPIGTSDTDTLTNQLREKWGCGGAIILRFLNRRYMDSPTSTTGGHGCGTMFLGTKFPVDLETWSRGFHRVVRWVKLQTKARYRARSIALACQCGIKVFLGLDGAFGDSNMMPEKPCSSERGVVTQT